MNTCAHLCKTLCSAAASRTPTLSRFLLPLPRMPVTVITRNYREIEAFEDGNATTIKGISYLDKNAQVARQLDNNDSCPLRSRGIQITHEDVLILRQFIASTGEILAREETGLSQREYFKVIGCVKMAQRANMLPGPENNSSVSPNGTKLNTYLTRYPVGTRSPIRGRGLWYRKSYYRVGDARVIRDAPVVGRRPPIDKH